MHGRARRDPRSLRRYLASRWQAENVEAFVAAVVNAQPKKPKGKKSKMTGHPYVGTVSLSSTMGRSFQVVFSAATPCPPHPVPAATDRRGGALRLTGGRSTSRRLQGTTSDSRGRT